MKVFIACFTIPKYMPYLGKYIHFIEEAGYDYDILYLNREENTNLSLKNNEYCYSYKMPIKKTFGPKIIPYLGYRAYAKKLLLKTKYDKIIFLTTAPAVLLAHYSLKRYKNKYILDYRDYTFERIKPYQRLVKRIIDNSYATFISSGGFKKFVGTNSRIYLTHNISNIDRIDCYHALKIEDKIIIGFVGCVRYFDINSKLIEECQHARVELLYVGSHYDDCDLRAFCKKNNYENVKFIDQFDNSEKDKLYSKITLVNAIYSLRSPEVSQAVPNRLYDAAIFRKPIIVSKNTYLEKIVKKYNLGIAVDMQQDDILCEIENYLSTYDPLQFEEYCKKFLNKVLEDEKICKNILTSFLARK